MGWVEVATVSVSAKPDGMWTWAHDWVEGPALIKFEAEGNWRYAPAGECSADGDLSSLIAARNCLMPDAPVGALIVKIGGSTAGAKDGKLFLAGHKAIVHIDQSVSGPILLSINDELTGMSDNFGSVEVKISIKKLPASAPSGPPPQVQSTPPQLPGPPGGSIQPVPVPDSGAAPSQAVPGARGN